MTEIRKARKKEVREKRRKLFPLRVVNFDIIRNWECFDAESAKSDSGLLGQELEASTSQCKVRERIQEKVLSPLAV